MKLRDLFESYDDGPKSLMDVARHFAFVYDDLHDEGDEDGFDLDDDADEASAMYVILKNYVSGDCDAFATAMHELTGWPIMRLTDQETAAHHSFVQDPQGRFVDVTGIVTLEQLKKRYGMRKAKLTPGEPEGIRDDEDPWDMVNVAKFVISRLNSPPFNSLR